uniref:Uncharacterized protein n=1 Tax=Cannabis sativa TaxID=3483 RepID=A0A803NIM0_CANSA
MEDYMKECMRKLALWHTRTFKPIMTHDELEPIMATLGFVGLPPSTAAVGSGNIWKEYVCSAGRWVANNNSAEPPPRPKLPYPKIDGLHIYTYRAFTEAVNFYLEMGVCRSLEAWTETGNGGKWKKMKVCLCTEMEP